MRANAILLLVVGGLGAGCVKKPYTIVRQAAPNPLAGQTAIAVEPVSYADLTVGTGTEAQYLTGKDTRARAAWRADKMAMAGMFVAELGTELGEIATVAPGSARFLLRPHVVFVDPGDGPGEAPADRAAPAAPKSIVRMSMTIVDTSNRQDVDEITIESSTVADTAAEETQSSGGRLRADMRRIGGIAGGYLVERLRAAPASGASAATPSSPPPPTR